MRAAAARGGAFGADHRAQGAPLRLLDADAFRDVAGPTDDPGVVREAAARLLDMVDTTGGVRLLGVGVSGLADYTQEDLFAQAAGERTEVTVEETADEPAPEQEAPAERRWPAGHDVRHAEFGHGWVQGSGLGRVTVRFETPDSEPGRVRTFRTDDPELEMADPLPLVAGGSAASVDGVPC